jgi:hypothetical protein
MTTDRQPFFKLWTIVAFAVLAVWFAARAVIGLGMQVWSLGFGWARGKISAARFRRPPCYSGHCSAGPLGDGRYRQR